MSTDSHEEATGDSTSATFVGMDSVGLRELRQNASELLRRVEQGEELLVTVAGRPAARLAPVSPDHWRRWEDVRDVFTSPTDDAWGDDLSRLDGSPVNPWDRTR